jgi:hypothetical protein
MHRIKILMRHSRKPKKFARKITVEQQCSEDPDELQLLDECNSEWAEAWKAVAKRINDLEVFTLEPVEQQKKLAKR